MRKLPSLRAVSYFESAARNLSFTRAADELSVTQAAVSHQIRYLEDELGIKLFVRTHQRIDLTAEGLLLLETATDVLDRLGDTLATVTGRSPFERLHISVTPLFSAYWLMPRLSMFSNTRKNTEIVLHHSLEPPHERLAKANLKVFWGGDLNGYERDELFTDHLVPMCSREMFESLKDKGVVEAMSSVNFIHEFGHEWWISWCKAENIDPNIVQRGTILDDPSALESAAILGHGLVLGSVCFLNRRIQSGEIVAPFGIRSPIEIKYCLFTKPSEMRRRSVREFRKWILATSKETSANEVAISRRPILSPA